MRPYDDSQDEATATWVKFIIGLSIAFGIFILGALFSAPAPAHELTCKPRIELIKELSEQHSEYPLWLGLPLDTKTGNGFYLELWGGDGSWTLLTGQNGGEISCFMSFGGDWSFSMPTSPPPSAQPVE